MLKSTFINISYSTVLPSIPFFRTRILDNISTLFYLVTIIDRIRKVLHGQGVKTIFDLGSKKCQIFTSFSDKLSCL